MNPLKVANILRNKEGLQNIDIGYGNEKALNQLLAHHGIIFKKKLLWLFCGVYAVLLLAKCQ